MSMDMQTKGLFETMANIRSLGNETFLRREISASGRKSMTPVKQLAVQKVPEDEGDLKRSLSIRSKVLRNKNISVRMGPNTSITIRQRKNGKIKKKRPAKYAHLVEKGTSRSRPKPFMRPAYDSAGGDEGMAKRFANHMEGSLQKARLKFKFKS